MRKLWLVVGVLLSTVWISGCSLFNPPSVAAPIVENMVQNGSFEDGLEHWSINFEGEGKSVDIDTEVAVDGSKSLRLFMSVQGTSIGLNQRIEVVPGQKYRIRGAARSGDDFVLAQNPIPNGILLRIQYLDANNVNLQQHSLFFLEGTDGEWIYIDEVITIPESAIKIWFEPMLFRANGTIWWDDLSMVPCDDCD